jgi:hypothetical protein
MGTYSTGNGGYSDTNDCIYRGEWRVSPSNGAGTSA